MPKKGYWVALADVSDPEGYKLYVAENAKRESNLDWIGVRPQ